MFARLFLRTQYKNAPTAATMLMNTHRPTTMPTINTAALLLQLEPSPLHTPQLSSTQFDVSLLFVVTPPPPLVTMLFVGGAGVGFAFGLNGVGEFVFVVIVVSPGFVTTGGAGVTLLAVVVALVVSPIDVSV